MPRGWRKAGSAVAFAILAPVLAATPAEARSTDVVASPAAAGESSAATLRYWTPRRMRMARPVTATMSRRGEQVRISASEPEAASRLAGTEAPFTTYAGSPGTYPDRTHGKVFFKLGRRSFVCSATVVSSPARNVVVTAGHCVHGGGRKASWARRWIFVPGYEDGRRPFGKFASKRLYGLRGWTRRENFNLDLATARLKPNKRGLVEDVVGARPIAWDQPRDLEFDVYGYPVAGSRFDHQRLYFCRTSYALDDPYPQPKGPDPLGVGCDLTEGASGGGWVTAGASGAAAPFVNSVTSFAYDDYPDVLFGPYFTAMTAGKLWARASGAAAAAAATP